MAKMNNDSNQKSMWKQQKSARLLMRSVSLFVASSRRASITPAIALKAISHERNQQQNEKNSIMQVKQKSASVRNKSSNGLVDSLKKQTHFTKEEIEKLCALFKKIILSNELSYGSQAFSYSSHAETTKNKGMDRIMFRELLHNMFHILTEDVLMDRIFSAFDRRSDGLIHMDEWVLGLSIFLRGTLEEQIAFSFFIYDLNSDGVITKEEIFTLLRNSLLRLPQDEDPDESVKDLADIALKKLDCDKDNKISFQDFRRAVVRDNLLLEALGECLPSEEVDEFGRYMSIAPSKLFCGTEEHDGYLVQQLNRCVFASITA